MRLVFSTFLGRVSAVSVVSVVFVVSVVVSESWESPEASAALVVLAVGVGSAGSLVRASYGVEVGRATGETMWESSPPRRTAATTMIPTNATAIAPKIPPMTAPAPERRRGGCHWG
ncbi:hypothetical protein ACQP10_14295 [Streptosporangium sandarakinum]|uniref:hypothetical protein n=1 Tax=Streptosporangium sandarakinum TaxID=1260955 RepID=UPI003D8DE35A